MRMIKVSDEVWDKIAEHGRFGETEDDVLRRVFGIADEQIEKPALRLPPPLDGRDRIYAAATDAPENPGLPHQAWQIVQILQESGPIRRSELLQRMEGRVQTVQGQARIFSFYRARLLKEGYIRET